jgi:hypothetical protein
MDVGVWRHHLALNIAIVGKQGVITPTLTGAQPSLYTSNGKTARVLAQENDKAFAFLNALDETPTQTSHDMHLEVVYSEWMRSSSICETTVAVPRKWSR